ncbi:MAG: Mth938-like domain-containing protein [PS1 clade bacterium]|jgi:uncharacterized protein
MEFNLQESNINSVISVDSLNVKLSHTALKRPCFISTKYHAEIELNDIQQIDKPSIFQLSRHDDIDLLIIGTGESSNFLHPKIQVEIQQMGIDVECMNNNSACHSFNLLLSDYRLVGLLIL